MTGASAIDRIWSDHAGFPPPGGGLFRREPLESVGATGGLLRALMLVAVAATSGCLGASLCENA